MPTFPSLNSNRGAEPFLKRNVLSSDDFQGFISDPPQSSPPLPARRRRFHDLKLNARIRFSVTSETLLRCEICTASPWTPQKKTLMEIKGCTVWNRSSSLKLDKVNADNSIFCFFKYLYIPFYHSYHIFSQVILQLCNFNLAVKKNKTLYYLFFQPSFSPQGNN